MSMMIKEAAISKAGKSSGSVHHTIDAVESCVKKAKIDINDIDILINTGIYKDHNIAEPAMAALIQKELKLNLDPPPDLKAKTTFSFDLNNGPCGFLYAAQVADCLIRNKEKKLVLVVSSDVHPSTKLTLNFPFTHRGSAVLLEESDNEESGFKNFMFETSKRGRKSYMGYIDFRVLGTRSRNLVNIDIAPDYVEKLEKHTVRAIEEHIKTGEINPSEIKLFITSQPTPDFGNNVLKSLRLREKSSNISTYEDFGNTGSSDLVLGYCLAKENGSLKKGDKILFVGAGSGLTVALAVYEV